MSNTPFTARNRQAAEPLPGGRRTEGPSRRPPRLTGGTSQDRPVASTDDPAARGLPQRPRVPAKAAGRVTGPGAAARRRRMQPGCQSRGRPLTSITPISHSSVSGRNRIPLARSASRIRASVPERACCFPDSYRWSVASPTLASTASSSCVAPASVRAAAIRRGEGMIGTLHGCADPRRPNRSAPARIPPRRRNAHHWRREWRRSSLHAPGRTNTLARASGPRHAPARWRVGPATVRVPATRSRPGR